MFLRKTFMQHSIALWAQMWEAANLCSTRRSVAIESCYWFIHSTIFQHVLKSSSSQSGLWYKHFSHLSSHRVHLRNTPLICTALNMGGETVCLIYFGGSCDLCFCVWYRHQECCVVWNVGTCWVGFFCLIFNRRIGAFFSKSRNEDS